MKVDLTRSQHAIVSYGLLAAVVLVVLLIVFKTPVSERLGFFENLENQRATYAKSLNSLAQSDAMREELARRGSESEQSDQLFHADTVALAGAELQNQLNMLVTTEGAVLLSSAFRERSETLPLTPITVTVRLRCSLASLLRILHGLENRAPILFVESFLVESSYRAGRPMRDSENVLDVELDIVGYLDR